jgi:hypothetical protein
MAFMFENLDVYQKAVDFADVITNLTAASSQRHSNLGRGCPVRSLMGHDCILPAPC